MQRKDFQEINNQTAARDKMDQNVTFNYKYSAKDNKELLEIRKRYLPQSESKIEELKRLDKQVQSSGVTEALCVGVVGLLIFGIGMCFAMQVLGTGVLFIALGVIISMFGTIGMITAYPVYRSVYNKTKEKCSPRILEIIEEMSGGK